LSRRKIPLSVQNLVLGCAPLGGLFQPVPESVARSTIRKALELGIKRIDTAPLYGFGRSETLIGLELSSLFKQDSKKFSPTEIKILTKIGRVLKHKSQILPNDLVDESNNAIFPQSDFVPVWDYSREGVIRSIKDSTKRLGVSPWAIHIHDAETDDRFTNAISRGRAVDTLIELRLSGLIKHLSAGLNNPEYLIKFAKQTPLYTFDGFLCAGSWNLLDHSALQLFLTCEEKDIFITNAGIFGSGILWGGKTLRYSESIPEDAKRRYQGWKKLSDEFRIPLAAIALQFAGLPSVVSHIAIGCRTPEEVQTNVDLLKVNVPETLWEKAFKDGLFNLSSIKNKVDV